MQFVFIIFFGKACLKEIDVLEYRREMIFNYQYQIMIDVVLFLLFVRSLRDTHENTSIVLTEHPKNQK